MSTPTFKAIETRYQGYRFRSRLEARHATFFDSLGIPWEYEREGYVLDGIPYLPDFWLPEHDHFIEIKGQKPTEEEVRKAQKLALYTGKLVYVISGNIGFPDDEYAQIQLYLPPSLDACKTDPNDYTSRRIDTPREVLALLQRLADAKLYFSSGENYFNGRYLVIEPYPQSCKIEDIQGYTDFLQQQREVLLSIAPLLAQHEEAIRKAFEVGEDEVAFFHPQMDIEALVWAECDACGDITIGSNDHTFKHYNCSSEKPGTYNFHSPRLIEAYAAARQARFDKSER